MAAFEYRQAEEIREAFARRGVRYLFLGKSAAILLGFPDTTQILKAVARFRVRTLGILGARISERQTSRIGFGPSSF